MGLLAELELNKFSRSHKMIRTLAALAAVGTAAAAHLRGSAPAPSAIHAGTCSVLALSGGGSFGAVQMGILDGLTAAGQAPASYDIVTGISAGGLNAGFLSYYANVTAALPDIYTILANLTNADVYTSAPLDILSEWSYYNTAPLEKTIASVLSARQPAAPTSTLTLVGSSNVLTKELDIWRFGELGLADQVDVLMATSAIPLVFPPRQINGSLYVDGGVIANEMITQAVGQLECDSYKVLFISASAKNQTAGPMPTGLWSYMGAVFDLVLDTFDYQLAQAATCPYPRGSIQACFPTAPALDNYSILDFNSGAALYALGKEAYACEMLSLC